MSKTSSPSTTLPPILKYVGGKRWLVPRLKRLYAPYTNHALVEPFCGALSVALGLNPQYAVLNDSNALVINLYQQIKNGADLADYGGTNNRGVYNAARYRLNDLIHEGHANGRQAAWLFYYLNRTGYNGLCRFNKKGEFNVPFGQYKTITYAKDFTAYESVFKRWKFMTDDFEQVFVHDEDWLYVDPPYDTEFTSYSPGGFTWNDQLRLANWLDNHHGPVVASNQATDRILKLYSDHGFDIELLDAPRRISCTGDRTPAKEMLATRNLEARTN